MSGVSECGGSGDFEELQLSIRRQNFHKSLRFVSLILLGSVISVIISISGT